MKIEMVNKAMLAAAAMVVAASLASARTPNLDSSRSSDKPTVIEIDKTAQIPGGPMLQTGEYRVVLTGNSATPKVGFFQNDHLIAEVPASVVNQGKKFDETALYTNTTPDSTQVITEIDVKGWNDKVLFGQNSGNSGSGQ